MRFKDEYEEQSYQFSVLQESANDIYYSIMDRLEVSFKEHLNNKYKHRFVANRQTKKKIEKEMNKELKKFISKKERYQKINRELLESFDYKKDSFNEQKNKDVDQIHNFIQQLTK